MRGASRWLDAFDGMSWKPTKPATSMEYETIPVATVVGGTPKLLTIPPSATGSEATLKDMIAWPSAIAIIGTQDSLVSLADAADAVAVAKVEQGGRLVRNHDGRLGGQH